MRSLCLCCLSVLVTATAIAQSPVPPAETAISDQLLRLIEQLDDGEFSVRQNAEQQLHQLGLRALPAIEAAALTGDVGVLTPVLRLLERMLIEEGPDIADAAERALERLAFSGNSEVMQRARRILSGNQHLRARRAIAAIRELGGRVEFMSLDDLGRGNVVWGGNSPAWLPGLPPVTIHVWILRDWQGGEEGLWHLTRLEDAWSAKLWKIEVTNVRGSGIPIEPVQSLAARLPHLSVHERGASLGVMAHLPNGVCIIGQILPDGPAEIAGLQVGDVVTQLDDIPITDFSDLVRNLLDFAPDQEVILTIRRGIETIEVPVTLGGWDTVKVASRPRTRPPIPVLPQRLPNLKQP